MSVLIFLAAIGAIVALAFIVSRITGARAHYLDDWKAEEGEQILFDDRQADTYLLPKLGQAKYNSYARLKRGFVIVTNRRILAGTRPAFTKRWMIQYMMYAERAPGDASDAIGGGLLTRGYQTFVVEPGSLRKEAEQGRAFVELTPSPAAASSLNLAAIRIYTDEAASFPFS